MLLLLGLLWGGVPNISKYVLLTGVPPFNYSFWVLVVACLSGLLINLVRGARFPKGKIVFYTTCGLSGTAVPAAAMYFSLVHIPAGLMVLIIATTPIMVYVIGSVWRIEVRHPLKTIGTLLGFVGTALILASHTTGGFKAPVLWVILAFVTPMCYAINTVYIARYRPQSVDIYQITTGMLIASVVFVFFVALAVEPIYPIWNAELQTIMMMIYHGILMSVAFSIFYALIHRSGPLYASLASYFVTLFGIAIGAVMHNEILPILVWVAALLILTGLACIQLARKKAG